MIRFIKKIRHGRSKGSVLIWLVIFISIFDSLLISKIHLDHKHISDDSVRYFEDINYARINMQKGINYLMFGITHDSKQSRDQAQALFMESFLSFEKSFSRMNSTELYQSNQSFLSVNIDELNDELNEFRKYIQETRNSELESDEHFNKIRVFSQNIGNKLDIVNLQVSNAVRDISAKHDYEFVAVLWISSFLLLLVCVIIFVINKAREEADESLRINRNMLASIIENSSSLIYLFDIKGRCLLANNAASSVFDLLPDEIIGKRRQEFMSPELASSHEANDLSVINSRKQIVFEETSSEGDELKTYLTVKFPLTDEEDHVYAVGGISTDITDRINSESKIKKSLEEKEILLRELYHRTKNNMQVIHSMLRIQSTQSKNDEVKTVLLEAGNKIMSMALVHQKLYQARNLSFIYLNEYLSELSGLISKSYNVHDNKIGFHIDVDVIRISIDAAIPLGLVVSELLSNAFKYAFPEHRSGIISIIVKLSEESIINMTFSDNGIGVPEGFDFRNQDSIGLKIIYAVVENQLQGAIEFVNDNGIKCVITFNNSFYSKTRV